MSDIFAAEFPNNQAGKAILIHADSLEWMARVPDANVHAICDRAAILPPPDRPHCCKTFYGRYAGTEGNLKTEVINVNLIDVPDPRGVAEDIAKRLTDSWKTMCKRDVSGLVEQALKECHTYDRARELASRAIKLPHELTQPDRRDLDDAVFELLGVTNARERSQLIDRLHMATTLHFRDVRVTEIQKMEDRRSGGSTKFAVADHAADAWDALDLPDVVLWPNG